MVTPLFTMAEEQPAAGRDAAARSKYFKLPDFWPESTAAWFGVVERQFLLKGVEQEDDKFSLVVSALPESSARRITHLLSNPPASPYTALKAALLSAHQLTDIQKAERLFNMDGLGSRRPMDLLSEMLELVKPGEEKTQLFAMLFLRRLPPHIRVQLTEDDHTDLRALAEKADRCAASWAAKHAAESGSLVAAAAGGADDADFSQEEGEVTVAAFGGKRGGKQRGGKRGWRGGRSGGRGGGGNSASGGDEAPAETARAATGLCKAHFRYGKAAYGCGEPKTCSWQGN